MADDVKEMLTTTKKNRNRQTFNCVLPLMLVTSLLLMLVSVSVSYRTLPCFVERECEGRKDREGD